MKFGRKTGVLIQILLDWLSASLSWTLLFLFRKTYIEQALFSLDILLKDQNFLIGISVIPIAWLVFYFISGTYTDVYRKSRLAELGKTLIQSAIGVLILFFVILIDDIVISYKTYYSSVSFLFVVHFFITAVLRLSLLSLGKINLKNDKYAFRTAIIGGKNKSFDFFNDYNANYQFSGQKFIGFINVNGSHCQELAAQIPLLGHIHQIEALIKEHEIQDVIIAIDSSEHNEISRIVNALSGNNVVIKIIPDIYDILSGKVKMNQVIGAPLIEIYPESMPKWQLIVKRALDVIVSFFSLLLLSPLLAYIALRVKLSSKGPIFYTQERVGYKGQPFHIFKFRSMYVDAEKDGPALSSSNDERITKWGRIIRKWRLDELPQFWNVLKGDMSLIGPRPERKYFIDLMEAEAPHCKHLQRVKPGITSLGMVKYGYAENVSQMIERLKYDIIYIENRSLTLDFKIVLYTIITLLRGRGK